MRVDDLIGSLTFLISFFLILLPVGMLLFVSFGGGVAGRESLFTLDNFNFFTVRWYSESLANSLIVAFGALSIACVFGILIAWILARTDVPLRRQLEHLVIIPFFVSPFVGALAWGLLAARTGMINKFIMDLFGLTDAPFNIYTLGGIIWVMGLYYCPLVYLIVSSAFASMDPALEESSKAAGAGTFKTFTKITLPMVLPSIASAALIVFTLAMGQFGIPSVLGRPSQIFVLTTRIRYLVSLYPPNYSLAAATSFSLIGITSIAVILRFRVLGERKFYTVTGRGFRPGRIRLGRWRYAALVFCVGYLLLTVVIPFSALFINSISRYTTAVLDLGILTLENYRFALFGYEITIRAIRNTLILAVAAATVNIVLTSVISYFLVRRKIHGKRVLEIITMLPIAIPSLIFAFGLLWFWVLTPLYGTIWVIFVAYVSHLIPYGIRSTSPTLSQIDEQLEEASRACGGSWFHTMRKITFPLLKPGMMAGWILLFVSFIRELSASIMLYTRGSEVLPVVMYDLWYEGSWPMLSALAIFQTILILFAVYLFRKIFKVELRMAD